MALIAKNEIAQRVLDHLPGLCTPEGGFFGGKTYCIGVPVKHVGDAFALGAGMGAEAEGGFGDVGFDIIGPQAYVVFREAKVICG